tara:strand:- start:65 stop:766 length:702 start_codon:yes stop_codon:yes gene_type:complete
MREEIIGDCRLILGDCRDILPTLGPVDAVVTDPPYGIGADKGQAQRAGRQDGAALAPSRDYGQSDWDAQPIDAELVALVRAAGQWQIIFGGNYFELPPTRCWLVWDKLNGANDYADCELAWTNLDKPVRRIRYLWHGMLRANGEERGDHPTQKPIGVMSWALGQLPPTARTIIDPFMGSGTTGVACALAGLTFTGIEREVRYFDAACRRIKEAYKQPRLFAEPSAKPIQEVLI